ncbi:MAG: YggT family protein [Thermoleophilia bacterium]|nr:YggT family protein [Thermoleophilia bacterium]
MTRTDIANYVSTLIWIYTILILIRILLTWVPRMPYNPLLNSVIRFVEDVTDPYLAIFRRFIPPLGMIDISPIVAILALGLVGNLVVAAIAG